MINSIEIRRQLHRLPELGGQEYKTSALIKKSLNELEIPTVGMTGTGIVGLIDNGKDKTVLLRADMDALPISEATDLPFSSEVDGVMHACGHDIHMAILLGTAQELMKQRDKLNCNVKLVFQPDEEGEGGAQRMIDEGVLDNPRVDAALAFHVWPDFPYGEVGIKYGELSSTCDEFEVEIKGVGGHIADPEDTVSPIVAAARFISEIESIQLNRPFIVEVCNVEACGGTNNIVPNDCLISGSMRVFSLQDRDVITSEIEKIARKIEKDYGVGCKFTPKFFLQFPPMINHSEVTPQARNSSAKFAQIRTLTKPCFFAEDFACFANSGVPSALLLLGCGGSGLHKGDFVPDERAIELGINIWSDYVLNQ